MALLAIVHIPDHTADDIESVGQQLHTLEQIYGSRVVGVYRFPNRSDLKCTGTCVRKNSGAWSRSPMGFMKCSICGSRNKRLRHWFAAALFDWFGANLIGDDAPALFRTPEGYGSSPSRHDG
jgi:hypothetical protein